MTERDIIDVRPAAAPAKAIIAEVAARHGLRPEDLKGRAVGREIAWPRQEAMAVLRVRTRLSTTQIGALLGGRDHSTVIHGIRVHERRRTVQP